MNLIVNNICVKNFKSLRDLKIEDCRRVNLFIGRPNVGKSNLLEALSLFSLPYLRRVKQPGIHALARMEHLPELYYDGNTSNVIEVIIDNSIRLNLERTSNDGLNMRIIKDEILWDNYLFNPDLTLDPIINPLLPGDSREVRLLSYRYIPNVEHTSYGISQLLPPAGVNLMEVVKQLPLLKDEANQLMDSYGLKLVFDNASQELKAMKEKSDEIFLIPFASLADSLQRMIFYKAAIMSNHGKAICLEEPETHTVPPYIASVVQDIIDSEDNQFFISTHSPYVVNTLMESLTDDLAIYFVKMTDGETEIKRALDEEVQEMYDNGVDLFFSMENYL